MKSKEFIDKDIYLGSEKIGKVRDVGIDTQNWKVTHLEIQLTKDAAESVLGAKKGGVHNMLSTSALEEGAALWTEKGLNIKVPMTDLHAYLQPVVES